MSLTPVTVEDDQRFEEWKRIIECIANEHVALAWAHYVFRLLREVFNANEELRSSGGFILNAIAEMYVTHALMVFRRDMDRRAGTENLVNLLYDIKANAAVVTRDRFLRPYRDSPTGLEDYGSHQFDGWSPVHIDGAGGDHLDPKVIQGEIDELNAAVESVRVYAERLKAHRSPADPGLRITYGEMHEAIRTLRKVINKYYALLTASSMAAWEPVPQYDVLKPFLRAWLPDDSEVLRAVLEAVERDDRLDA